MSDEKTTTVERLQAAVDQFRTKASAHVAVADATTGVYRDALAEMRAKVGATVPTQPSEAEGSQDGDEPQDD